MRGVSGSLALLERYSCWSPIFALSFVLPEVLVCARMTALYIGNHDGAANVMARHFCGRMTGRALQIGPVRRLHRPPRLPRLLPLV